MECQELCDRLNAKLDTAAYAECDPSANGLQVGPATQSVSKVAFAVDAAVETFDRAADWGADLLVTHHGIAWGSIERITGKHYRRIGTLIDTDTSLYAAHLPLDGHQSLGNAAGVADVLDLGNRAPFGTHSGQYIGQRGRTQGPVTIDEIRDQLADSLQTGEGDVRVLDFGPSPVQDVAIVTGSGTDWLEEAAETDADVLVTGEGKQSAYHEAREAGIHVVLAGHYATETFGVKALQELVDDWGPETRFIDCPTGL